MSEARKLAAKEPGRERTRKAGAGAMLVACRLAGLSALSQDYAVKVARAQFGPTQRSFNA